MYKLLKINLKESKYEDYISVFFMGEVGNIPIRCEVNNIEIIEDSVIVCGKVFDKYSGETVNVDISVGAIVEKTNQDGFKDLVPVKRELVFTTDNDGIFCTKFKVKENDILFMDQIGYDPAIFEIYDFLKDADLLK